MSSSRGSSLPRDLMSPALAGGFVTTSAPWEPLKGVGWGGMLSGSDCFVIRCPSWVGECPCSGKLDSPTQVEFLFHSHRTWIRLPITAHVPATNNICLSRGLLVFCALFSTVVHLAPSTGAQQTLWE